MTKREAYQRGLYKFSPPPVCTAAWGEDDWIAYITHWTVAVEVA